MLENAIIHLTLMVLINPSHFKAIVGLFIRPGEMTGSEPTLVMIDIAIQLPRNVKIQYISSTEAAILLFIFVTGTVFDMYMLNPPSP